MRWLASTALLLTGCWMSQASPPDPSRDEAADPEGTIVEATVPAEGYPDDGVGGGLDRDDPLACARTEDGEHDFTVRGQGFEEHEGVTVHASAVEPDGDISLELVAMRQSAVVAGGAFTLGCPRSIHDNGWYPSWALFLDLDGDGACSDGDLGYQEQFYAWDEGIDATAPAPSQGWFDVIDQGLFGQDFCAYYGF